MGVSAGSTSTRLGHPSTSEECDPWSWYEQRCTSCPPTKWGNLCDKECTPTCLSNNCDRRVRMCNTLLDNACVKCPENCRRCTSLMSCLECTPEKYGSTCHHNCVTALPRMQPLQNATRTIGCGNCAVSATGITGITRARRAVKIVDGCRAVPWRNETIARMAITYCPVNCNSCVSPESCTSCSHGYRGETC